MDAKQLKAVENIKRAVDVNDGDTLSSLRGDGQVLWTASGSWSGSENVTLGDLRAIAAIAPPVAAGSVDTEEFRELLDWVLAMGYRVDDEDAQPNIRGLVAHIDAWAAQHVANAIKDLIERAEKAEADLNQVNEWRAAALASNQQLHELMVAKLDAAEAYVSALESAIDSARNYEIPCGADDLLEQALKK